MIANFHFRSDQKKKKIRNNNKGKQPIVDECVKIKRLSPSDNFNNNNKRKNSFKIKQKKKITHPLIPIKFMHVKDDKVVQGTTNF